MSTAAEILVGQQAQLALNHFCMAMFEYIARGDVTEEDVRAAIRDWPDFVEMWEEWRPSEKGKEQT